MKIPRLLAALPLLLTGLCVTVPAAENVTTPEQLFPQLDAILRSTVAQSPRMVSRAIDLDIAEEARIMARANLLPNAGGYFNYFEARDDRADGAGIYHVTKLAYNFSVTQPIFHWGERRNNNKMGEIRRNLAQGQYREGYRLLAQELRAQYMRLILGKLRTARMAYYRDYTANQSKLGEERLLKKVISEAQLFSIRMEAEKAQIAYERTSFDYENDKASFARLTGLPQLKDEEIPDSIPQVTTQEDAIRRLLAGYLAQKDPPTMEAIVARQNLEIERFNLANQKTRLKPKFNFVVGASQDEQSYSVNVAAKYQVKSYYAGLAGNWSIFDGFVSGASVRTTYARIRQLEQDYRKLTEALAVQVQTWARLIEFNARYASLNDRYLTSSEGNLVSKREELRRGVVSEETVSSAQMGVYDSKLTAYTSRADYYALVSEFLGAVVEDPVLGNLANK